MEVLNMKDKLLIASSSAFILTGMLMSASPAEWWFERSIWFIGGVWLGWTVLVFAGVVFAILTAEAIRGVICGSRHTQCGCEDVELCGTERMYVSREVVCRAAGRYSEEAENDTNRD